MAVGERTEGLVDVTLLDARLAAEGGAVPHPGGGRWWLAGSGRHRIVGRDGRVSFDLDGVGKGWIADRALALCASYPSAMVDADGDVAIRVDPATPWEIAVADPRMRGVELAVLRVPTAACGRRLGIATSGTSVHRWRHRDGERHHIIDPRTGRSARTDIVQATVVAAGALEAEGWAKAAVILGSDDALDLLERSDARAAVLLLEDGEVVATTRSLEWLA
jgi:thiamine biosynthesis lipoprotein